MSALAAGGIAFVTRGARLQDSFEGETYWFKIEKRLEEKLLGKVNLTLSCHNNNNRLIFASIN